MVWKQDNGRRLAKSLVRMIDDIDAKLPERDRDNDGTIGDPRHQAAGSGSDHNPWVVFNGEGIVRALDVTHDPSAGFDAGAFAEALRQSQDPRIEYVIFNGRIFSSSKSPWTWRDRNKGPDDHSAHVHVSVVQDPAKFDDAEPWAAVGQILGGSVGKTPGFPPKLRLGDSGPAVLELQGLLQLARTGTFDEDTDRAVRVFQASRNLEADGIVGTRTWGALTSIARPLTITPATTSPNLVEQVARLAALSDLARFKWADRGLAPIGYVKGMAVAFARVYAKWKAGDPAAVLMAAPKGGNASSDALVHYDELFAKEGMRNDVGGADTLRHLFVLLIGLGMRESSGRYFCGRDTTATNVDADTAEAGLFQMSWNMRSANSEMRRLFALYSAEPDGLLPIFAEGTTPNLKDLENFGTGEGVAYQKLAKSCPLFAVETAAVGLRVRRRHWGPINRREAQVRPEADRLLKSVQEAVDAAAATVPSRELPVPNDTGAIVISPHPAGEARSDGLQLGLLILALLTKEKAMNGTRTPQGLDPMKLLLPALIESILSGRQLNSADLLRSLTPNGQSLPSIPPPPAPPGGVDAALRQALQQSSGQTSTGLPPEVVAVLKQLVYEKLVGQPMPGTPEAKTETPPAPQPAMTRPSVQISAAALAGVTVLQMLGVIPPPFQQFINDAVAGAAAVKPVVTQVTNAVPIPAPAGPGSSVGTLATVTPIVAALVGATGGFGSLLSGLRAAFGGLGRVLTPPK